MTTTPWGRADELRSRKLPPGPKADRAAVRRNQRERLMGAAIAVVAEHGYTTARVEDVVQLAGISRNTFYGQFANKHDCVVTTVSVVADAAIELIDDAVAAVGDDAERRLAAALGALADAIVDQPTAAWVGYGEAYAIGAEGLAQLDRIDDRLRPLARAALSGPGGGPGPPATILEAVLGALRVIVRTRLAEDRPGELPGLMPQLIAWMRCYRAPIPRLRRPRRVPAEIAASRPRADGARRRILYALTDLVAERGYGRVSISDLASSASVSLTTFYELFDGKEGAFLATLDDAQERVLQSTVRAFERGDPWETAVVGASHRFLGFLATEPTTTQLGVADAWVAGPAVFELRTQGRDLFRALLTEGFRLHPATDALAGEAIAAALDALMFGELRRHGAPRLYELAPTGAFITLAPFVGAERAGELANEPPRLGEGGDRGRRQGRARPRRPR